MARRRGNKEWEYHLRVLRWRKLLENAARLMTLFDDAAEKVQGEYIFDLHYVHSLPDDILDSFAEMLLDARVLAADGLDDLADQQIPARRAAEALRGQAAEQPGQPSDDDHLDFPEYRLLNRFIDTWIEGAEEGGLSQRARFWQLVERAADAFLRAELPWSGAAPLGPRLPFCDLDGSGGMDGRDPGTICRAWSGLAVGLGAEGTDPAANKPCHWVLGISGDHFTLHRPEAEGGLILDASLQGHRPSDHLFLFSRKPLQLDEGAFAQFGLRQTDGGHTAWLTKASPERLASALGHLGEALLAV